MADTATLAESNGTGTLADTSPDMAVVAKATALPIGTVEAILAAAPSDLKEEVVEVPEWGCSVKIKSLTAAQSAVVKQKSLILSGQSPDVAWAAMEKAQFEEGVIEPKFSPQDVNVLHHNSGVGFARVIAALDRLSGTDKEELRKAQDSFPSGEQAESVTS